ncbi:MAG: hypothetical protein OXU29_06895, partial [Gammaproteobacteria bacterium]|nr:hypothetical protein [Gammaproteobacteria bacterium]MDD9850277.1 hypothetical protein [Gammaproteobacteria bacterium]
ENSAVWNLAHGIALAGAAMSANPTTKSIAWRAEVGMGKIMPLWGCFQGQAWHTPRQQPPPGHHRAPPLNDNATGRLDYVQS